MDPKSKLKSALEAGESVVTAELLPGAGADPGAVLSLAGTFSGKLTAVNVADNPQGPVMSSLAGSRLLADAGVEPVFQLVTRDRNRIALQSDILGAAALGIRNLLCLSGHHQSLTTSRSSANVFDIDSFQLIACARAMRDTRRLLDGTVLTSELPLFIGAVAGPDMTPMDLNMIRLSKKIGAGAEFIQTQAVFRPEIFEAWIAEANTLGLTEKAFVIAGVLPLESADEARILQQTYTDIVIPDTIVNRLDKAGDPEAQKREGLAICREMITALRSLHGVRGIHLFTGGKEGWLPDILAAADL